MCVCFTLFLNDVTFTNVTPVFTQCPTEDSELIKSATLARNNNLGIQNRINNTRDVMKQRDEGVGSKVLRELHLA